MKNFINRALVAKKHLKLFFALFAMLALGVGNAWGALTEEYSYTFTAKQFSNNNTAKTLGSVTWTPATTWSSGSGYWGYDGTKGQQWGSSSNTLNKMILTSGTSFSNVKKIEINASIASDGGCKLSVKVGNTTIGTTKTLTKTATAYTFEDANGLTGAVEITLSNGSKKKAQYIKSIKIYTESSAPEKVLSSIEISGDLENKTYEEGEELNFAGLTVTAKYDDKSEKDVTKDVEWSYTPNPLTKGTPSVDVTATYTENSEEKTKTKTITGLTVNEHVVTPDEYCIVPNNAFWGTSYNGSDANAATTLSGTQNDISILHTKSGSNLYVNNTQTRVYTNHAMQISVPLGYVITSIAFTADGSNWAGTHTANVGTMTDSKNWAGIANEVTITFGGTCRITKICVNYIKDAKYVLTITEPAVGTGTLVVKDGANVLTSGAEIYEGTELTVTATPATGYEGGTIVVKDGSDNDVTSTVYADGVLTMPAYAVTISATFDKKPCTLLTTPVVTATPTYNSATLTWAAVTNAAKYSVTVGETTTEVTEPTFTATGLNAETTYTYQVQAIAEAEQDTYCDSEVAEGSFTTAAAPVATLTLSDIEGTTTKTGALNGTITLPKTAAECSKTFVGWDADENCDHAPTYAPGAEYTFTTQYPTLYAVYADGEAGEVVTIKHNIPSTGTSTNMTGNNDAEKFFGLDVNDWSILSAKNGAQNHIGVNKDGTLRLYYHADGGSTLTITAPKDIASIVLNCNSSYKNAWVKVNGSPVTPVDGVYSINAKTVVIGNANTENKQVYVQSIEVTLAGELSNYSTDCAAAPTAEVDPTSVTATAAETTGKLTVTYDNVNTEDVTVALYNDAACTDAFNADWLTASLDDDKNIAYTVAATTLYTERKAYIKLTAPETTGAVDPAVVVIPVTQAAKDKVFASLAELVAADLAKDDAVTVTLTNDVIKEFYVYNSKRCGVVFDVQKGGEDIKIYFNNQTTIGDWAVGGKLSGILTNVKWTTYNNAWQLAPANTWAWANLTYTEPKAVSTVVVSGTPTKTTYVDGEAFDPAGLTVTVNYNDATNEVNPTGVTFSVTPSTLTKGETSVQVTATYNTISSATYEVTGLTVNDIPTKTVAEFIAARGTRCYLEGVVSGLTEGNSMKYGNFDLTDASNTIYVYGCLNASGEKEKFAELDVKNGDKIKVIAEELTVYNSKDQAKNVQYVSHISAATITIANITMEVGETKTISATLDPAEAKVTYTIKKNTDNAISLSGNTITALAEGTATITATVAEGTDYLGNSVDFTVTVTPQNIATLPFAFDGGVDDVKNTLGMSQKDLGGDYGSSPKLKFDDKDDYVIIHFNERPGKLTYDIKANTGNAQAFSGTFTVQESADGVTYRNLAVYTTINTTKESKTHNCFDKDTRYIKFIFTTKGNGNVALGNIKIEKSVVTKVTPTIVENSYFSVGNNKYVQFSTGNLQYEVGTNTWSFASEQYEVIGGAAYDGTNNTNYGMNEPGYTGKLDLFGWSSDGKFGVNPSNADADYTDAFVDWGKLVDGENWYTLSASEMHYLLSRKKGDKKLWATAELDGKVVLILLPDNWDTTTNLAYGYVPATGNFEENVLDIDTWKTLEKKGAVLLPSGGSRTGGYGNKIGFDGETEETDDTRLDANDYYFHVNNVGDYGYYWLNTPTSSEDCVDCAAYLITPGFIENDPTKTEDDQYTSPQVPSREKRRGNSVRLVKVVEPVYTRDKQGAGVYGTVCYPENIVWVDGATLYEVAGKEGNKVIFDEVTTPEAGMPYIFIAEQEKVNFFCGSESATEAGKHNSLQGTFTQIDPAVDNILVDNYMLVNNIIKKCGINCGLYANRAYFIGDELVSLGTASSPVQGRRRISLEVTNENTATGIDGIVVPEGETVKVIVNGQLIIIRDGEKYNAQGIKF